MSGDVERAKNRIIMYSPFVTLDRVSFLLPMLQAAIERGVKIYVITKVLEERSRAERAVIENIEARLAAVGIVVIH